MTGPVYYTKRDCSKQVIFCNTCQIFCHGLIQQLQSNRLCQMSIHTCRLRQFGAMVLLGWNADRSVNSGYGQKGIIKSGGKDRLG